MVRSVRVRSNGSLLGLPSLFFIYALLSILGGVFASAFFAQTIRGVDEVLPLFWLVFLSIPVILSAFLVLAAGKLVRDVLDKRVGSKLRARLLAFFFATVILSSIPSIVIASRFVQGITEAWFSAGFERTLEDAAWFATDSYRQRLEALERFAKRAAAGNAAVEPPIASLQTFARVDGSWAERSFAGDRSFALREPPAQRSGFLPRDTTQTKSYPSGRDKDVIRYIIADERTVRIATLSLGPDFDAKTDRLAESTRLTGAIGKLRPALSRTLGLLYAAFLFPSILMTLLIAFTLANSVTQPLVSLADATKRVAEGDFSIRIIERPGDELGTLVASFNAMVRELDRSRAALLRTETINLWQDMAQRLAHEIKNPLTPIKLSAERVLRRARTEPERLGEIVESSMLAIVQEVDGLTAMLGDFRAFARMPPPMKARARLRNVVEEAVALYRTSYPEIVFDCEGVGVDIHVDIDRRHIAQVLSNLIINAVDAMSGRGRVEFRTELVKKRDSRYCRLSIKDSGKGIPEEERRQVFTPYFTTKESGTGLGLPIVERIVNDHGGSVWFDSAVGAGTTFYIDLPIGN